MSLLVVDPEKPVGFEHPRAPSTERSVVLLWIMTPYGNVTGSERPAARNEAETRWVAETTWRVFVQYCIRLPSSHSKHPTKSTFTDAPPIPSWKLHGGRGVLG